MAGIISGQNVHSSKFPVGTLKARIRYGAERIILKVESGGTYLEVILKRSMEFCQPD